MDKATPLKNIYEELKEKYKFDKLSDVGKILSYDSYQSENRGLFSEELVLTHPMKSDEKFLFVNYTNIKTMQLIFEGKDLESMKETALDISDVNKRENIAEYFLDDLLSDDELKYSNKEELKLSREIRTDKYFDIYKNMIDLILCVYIDKK